MIALFLRRSALLGAVLALAHAAAAQPARPYVRLDGLAVQPLGGLGDRFAPTATAALAYGWHLAPTRTLEVGLTGVRFRKGTLHLSPDTTGSAAGKVDADSLSLSLGLAGGTIRFAQRLGGGRVAPRLVLGAGLFHWVDRRGAYPSRGLTATARRTQWSGALEAGLGTDVALAPRLALALDAAYHLLPADLWGAQRVRLAPVSSFQYATLSAGLKVRLTPDR